MSKDNFRISLYQQIINFIKINYSNKTFKTKDVRNHFKNVPSSSIRGNISQLTEKGILKRINYGTYIMDHKYGCKVDDSIDLLLNAVRMSIDKYTIIADDYIKLDNENQKRYIDVRNQLKAIVKNNL